MKIYKIFLISLMVIIPMQEISKAAEFRSISPISTSISRKTNNIIQNRIKNIDNLPQLLRESESLILEKAKKAIYDIATSWNGEGISNYLSMDMVNRDRFLDSLVTENHQDAKLRILSLESVRPINQQVKPDFESVKPNITITTRVSVRAKTQIEYNSPTTGFNRIEGVNEFILLIDHNIPLKVN